MQMHPHEHSQPQPLLLFAEPQKMGSHAFAPPASDDCLSAILSSPALSGLDELSPYPAPPSTASSTPAQLALPATLSVSIPPAHPGMFLDFVPPLSAGTDASFSSSMPLYSPLPVVSSGCLYESAAQQHPHPAAFPPHFNFRAPAAYHPEQHHSSSSASGSMSGWLPYAHYHPHSTQQLHTATTSSGLVAVVDAGKPAALGAPFVFSAGPAPDASRCCDHATSSAPSLSSFIAPVPSPHYATSQEHHQPLLSSPHFLPQPQQQQQQQQSSSDHYSSNSSSSSSSVFPPLPRTQAASSSSAASSSPSSTSGDPSTGLNLYDASAIRDSGILFAPNGRILLACSFCKLRKLRCNGGTPGCSQCTKRGLCCSYPSTIRRRGKAKSKTRSSSGTDDKDAANAGAETGSDYSGDAGDDYDASVSAVSVYGLPTPPPHARSGSEKPEAERSRKRKCAAFDPEFGALVAAGGFKKRSQSCNGNIACSLAA